MLVKAFLSFSHIINWAKSCCPTPFRSSFTFLGSARPIATPGVEQNSPTLMPGVAKVDFSVATAISQLATNWQPAAVATPFTIAMTGTGRSWIRVMTFEKDTVIWLRWHTLFCTVTDLWPLSRSGTPCCDTRGPRRRSAPWGHDLRKTRAPALQRETQSYCGRLCLNRSFSRFILNVCLIW